MAIFDKRLIAPDEAELVDTLRKAMKVANRENRYQTNRMTRDAAFWGRFAQDVLRSGPAGRRRSCKGGRAVPEVVAGWWTDPAGRKHVRIVGRTRLSYSRLRGELEMRSLPPWWHVYPEAVLGIRGKKEGECYLAVCRCGAVGSPESLGWMGDTCGPCFDRRAEGGTPSGGFGQFGGWSPNMVRFCFSADGRHLVGQNKVNCFCKVDREDGTATTCGRRSFNHVIATASNAGGTTLVLQDGSVVRWPAGAAAVEQVLHARQAFWGRVAITPDASRVALSGYQRAFTADLTAARPRYTSFDAPEIFSAMHFARDGSRILVVNNLGELRSVDPNTMASHVVRRDILEGAPGGYGPPDDVVFSTDGATALVRRPQASPHRIGVWHVSLETGKAVALNVPPGYRPTTLAYSTDCRHAVTVDAEGGWVGFFDVSSGKSLGYVRAVLEDVSWRSGQVEFSSDGRAIAVSYSAGLYEHGSTIAVWPWPEALQAAALG